MGLSRRRADVLHDIILAAQGNTRAVAGSYTTFHIRQLQRLARRQR